MGASRPLAQLRYADSGVRVYWRAVGPVLTALQRVGARRQQAFSEATGAKHLALTKRDVTEVVAGRTTLVTPKGVQIPVVHKPPLLHRLLAVQKC